MTGWGHGNGVMRDENDVMGEGNLAFRIQRVLIGIPTSITEADTGVDNGSGPGVSLWLMDVID